MRATGNLKQWQGGYPDCATVTKDISEGKLYKVCEDTDDTPIAVFYFGIGPDSTYLKIYEGEWLYPEREYGVIHRIALSSEAHGRGVGGMCFDYCYGIIPNIRIDTHRDNRPMRSALIKAGFTERGIIYLASGDERIAYQRV